MEIKKILDSDIAGDYSKINDNFEYIRKTLDSHYASSQSTTIIIGFTGGCDVVLDPSATGHNEQISEALVSLPLGGKIILREGTYSFNNSVSLSSNIILEGMGNSTIITTSNSISAVFSVSGSNNKIANVRFNTSSSNVISLAGGGSYNIVENCSFLLSSGTSGSIWLSSGRHDTIKGCVFEGVPTAIIISSGDWHTIEGNRFISCSSPITSWGSSGGVTKIVNNKFEHLSSTAISHHSGHLVATSNTFSGSYSTGISMSSVPSAIIANNLFTGSSFSSGICLSSSYNVTIASNVFSSSSAISTAISASSVNTIAITGNVFGHTWSGGVSVGVSISSGSKANVSNNIFNNVLSHALATWAENFTISDNIITASSSSTLIHVGWIIVK